MLLVCVLLASTCEAKRSTTAAEIEAYLTEHATEAGGTVGDSSVGDAAVVKAIQSIGQGLPYGMVMFYKLYVGQLISPPGISFSVIYPSLTIHIFLPLVLLPDSSKRVGPGTCRAGRTQKALLRLTSRARSAEPPLLRAGSTGGPVQG